MVTTLVLHTAEGARTYQELGNYFASSSSGVSSHSGIDDTPGTIGVYVRRGYKAWTQGNANPWSVSAELCAFAKWTEEEWSRHPTMLENTAAWLYEEAAAFGIPLTKLNASQAADPACKGVCQHNDLGAMGGGHWDCGSGFPIERVLTIARSLSPSTAPEGRETMILQDSQSGGYWVTDGLGAIYAYDGAPYLGGCNNKDYNEQGWPCVGIARFSEAGQEGYCLALDSGSATERFRRYRFPRDGSAAVT